MESTVPNAQHVLFERIERDGKTWAEITLNRPEKGNALTMPMLRRIAELVEVIEQDRTLLAVVLRARGRYFCTGGDIADWGALSPHDMAQEWILPGIEVFHRLASLPQPTIAVISGHVFGGGLELALAADLRIAARAAKFGVPEVRLGMISGWMGVRRLSEMIGVARARHMALLGLPVSADQALDWGLVTSVAEDSDELEQQLSVWLDALCSNAPAAMSLVKGLFATMHQDMRHHHAAAVAQAAGTDDCREGVRAFREKRKPVFGMSKKQGS